MNSRHDAVKEKSFLLSIGLTTLTFVFELVGGLWSGSLALLSDSAHVFLDVFALGISYLALKASARPADDTHSYGFHRLEVLAALLNGLTLLAISFGIFYEAWKRWNHPADIKSGGMLVIAVLGLIVNIVVARVLHGGHHEHEHAGEAGRACPAPGQPAVKDLNVHSAYLHVIGDAISSVGVILAAVVIRFTGWPKIDPLMSAVIGLIILAGSFQVLRSSVHILVEGVPEGIDMKEVIGAMLKVDGVGDIHDIHVWNICSGTIALSAHVLTDETSTRTPDEITAALNAVLRERFGIGHTTIQIEKAVCSGGCD